MVINANKTIASNVLISGEKIEAIGAKIQPDTDKIIDASGKYVIPGGIDVHTHLDMPFCGTTSSDDFETGTIAAALGGTTSIVDFAIQDQGNSLNYALETWMAKAEGKATIDYSFHCIMREFNRSRKDEMASLVREGITSFKLFTAYPGVFMMHDGDIFRTMQHAGELGASISVHAENGYVINVLIEQALAQGHTSPQYHALTRPAESEAEAVHRVIALADMAKVPVYIVHLSSAEGLDEVKYAKLKNRAIFAETCPQYLFLSHKNYEEEGFNGAKYVMSPPLRPANRQEDLWLGLKDNDIQVVATDHCPFFFKNQKEMGLNDFTKIPNGAPAIETRIGLIYDGGVVKERLSLQRWVEVVSAAPAKLFGMYPKKGVIKAGSDADIVIFDPRDEQILDVGNLHMNTDYSPYEGMKLKGATHTVISRGKVIVEDKIFTGSKGHGQFLKRQAGAMTGNI